MDLFNVVQFVFNVLFQVLLDLVLNYGWENLKFVLAIVGLKIKVLDFICIMIGFLEDVFNEWFDSEWVKVFLVRLCLEIGVFLF